MCPDRGSFMTYLALLLQLQHLREYILASGLALMSRPGYLQRSHVGGRELNYMVEPSLARDPGYTTNLTGSLGFGAEADFLANPCAGKSFVSLCNLPL